MVEPRGEGDRRPLDTVTVSISLPFVVTYGAGKQLDALGDPTRRAILERLLDGPLAVVGRFYVDGDDPIRVEVRRDRAGNLRPKPRLARDDNTGEGKGAHLLRRSARLLQSVA